MLHEIAHLDYGVPDHNEKWADRLITLHEQYLKGTELKRAHGELANDYSNAAKAFKRRFGAVPKRIQRRRNKSVEDSTDL
jgi:methylphosphotriester-DNA--protein-cysteine methyltransferase